MKVIIQLVNGIDKINNKKKNKKGKGFIKKRLNGIQNKLFLQRN